MSEKSHSNQHKTNENGNKNIANPSDDNDFWNLENNTDEPNTLSDGLAELEEILEGDKSAQSIKPLSNQELTIEVPNEEEILNSLDRHIDNDKMNDLSHTSNKSTSGSLATATAMINAEQEKSQGTPESATVVQKAKKHTTPAEKIATLACYLTIVGVFTYLVIYASEQHNFDTTKSYEGNTPATGDYANIKSIETWWSKPVGANTRFGVILVPAATITLDSNSKSGVIRSVFHSYEKGLQGRLKTKGDPFTHKFENGKFLSSGTNQVTVYSTDGYEELAHFLFYKSQDENRWTLEVKEAPSIDTKINSFQALANAPIEPLRK